MCLYVLACLPGKAVPLERHARRRLILPFSYPQSEGRSRIYIQPIPHPSPPRKLRRPPKIEGGHASIDVRITGGSKIVVGYFWHCEIFMCND